jgi:hypothetical protein
MSETSTPQHRDADDAKADGGPPTDAVSDEVKADSASGSEPSATAPDADTDTESQDRDGADAAAPDEPVEDPAGPKVDEPTD